MNVGKQWRVRKVMFAILKSIRCLIGSLTASNNSLFTPALLRTHSFFSLLSTKPAKSFSVLSSQRHQDLFLHSFGESSFHSRMVLQLALSLVVSSVKSVCYDFSIIFCSDAPVACPLFSLVRNSVVHSPSSVIRDPRYGNVSTCSSSSF